MNFGKAGVVEGEVGCATERARDMNEPLEDSEAQRRDATGTACGRMMQPRGFGEGLRPGRVRPLGRRPGERRSVGGNSVVLGWFGWQKVADETGAGTAFAVRGAGGGR